VLETFVDVKVGVAGPNAIALIA